MVEALAAFGLSLVFVWAILSLARRKSWFDHHDERKIHSGQVPRLGGIGFSTAFIAVAVGIAFMHPQGGYGLRFIPVLLAMPLILGFGVVDDFKVLQPRVKLLVQSIAAVLVLSGNYTFHRVGFSVIGFNWEFGLLKYPITFLWIVGVTNALNLIDGVDGLAGGVAALAALTYAALFAAIGNTVAASLCLALAGAVAGFLAFNLPLPKAKIFMGDGGSQFLGFTLAVLPLLDKGNNQANLPLPFAAALLLIPIFDTFAAIWRRTRDGRRIDSPDKAHMHHKLMNLGLGARGVDAVVYALQACLGLLVYLAVRSAGGWKSLLLLLAAYLIAAAFFTAIHYLNRGAMKRSGTA